MNLNLSEALYFLGFIEIYSFDMVVILFESNVIETFESYKCINFGIRL